MLKRKYYYPREQKYYSVTYFGNGNTAGSAPEDYNSPYRYGDRVTVLDIIKSFIKSGFRFNGWNTEADGSGIGYSANDTFIITADIDLYAQWVPIALNAITVKASPTEGGSVSGSGMYYINDTVEISTTPNQGYNFVQWDDGNQQLSRTIVVRGAATYTAQYAIKPFTVTFDLNGHGSTTPPPQTVSYNGYATKPTNPSDSNYFFDGWYVQGSSIEWDFSNDKVTHDVTLHASWKSDQDQRATVLLNTGKNYPDWNWGEIVQVEGNVVTKISDAPSIDLQNGYYYVGVLRNEEMKLPWARKNRSGSSSAPIARTISPQNISKLYIGEQYRFLAGFQDSRVQIYGVRLIHTDTVNGATITTEEVIPFNSEPFIFSWGSDFTTYELQFTAHQTTQIIILFTQFPTS